MIIKDNKLITLEGPIMRRVYLLWLMRTVTHSSIWRLGVLTAVVWQLNAYASMARVWANAPAVAATSWREEYKFFLNAFSQTELATKGLSVALIVMGSWIVWDVIRLVPRVRWFRFGRAASL
jgi:hypothetical protein